MNGMEHIDLYATKDVEYLLVIGYLAVLVVFWALIERTRRPELAAAALAVKNRVTSWFSTPEQLHYHQGHTWAALEGRSLVRVGADDFAHHLVGAPSSLALPKVGDRLAQGASAWQLNFGDKKISMVAPVDGEVVAVNEEAMQDPAALASDPYGTGWLIKLKVPEAREKVSSLLSGTRAQTWMKDTTERLQGMMSTELGPVLQDGGVPVAGFARQLAPTDWDKIAEEFFQPKA